MSSEQREATVVFADISGFTAISERMDPEDVTAVMNRCFEVLEGIIIGHGGAINKYLGDCVMAVFGMVDDSTDTCIAAVEAAIEIREAIYEFNRESRLPAPLDIHVGIGTGLVIAGEIGGSIKREYTVTGDAVALAAYLEDLSAAGQIYVGPATYEYARELFEFRPVETITLREDHTPIQVYEYVAVKHAHKRIKRDSERRQATILFADLSGFKALSACMDAMETTAVLNRCFTRLEAVVVRHGGIVDKYIGECMMALFGVPNAIENAPRQAVNAAIEIRRVLAELNAEEALPVAIAVHIGINTGLVIAGEIGGRVHRDYTVMGDAVNLASRLKDAAALGSIYVGAETHRYAREAFEYRTLPPLSLKGKTQPVSAYEVLSVVGRLHRERATAADGISNSGLIGRREELELLLEQVERLDAGGGSIVYVIGEAGLGKSRLVSELLATDAVRAVRVLEGRATSIGQNLSFHPFVDLFRHWARIAEDDDEAAARSKLAQAVDAVLPGDDADTFPLLATLMGIPLEGGEAARIAAIDGDALQKLLFKSVRQLLQAMAQRQALLVVLDDFHWADQSSVRLLEVLLRSTADRPLMFMCIFRPDFAEAATTILPEVAFRDPRHFVEMRLPPLSVAETRALITNLLGTDDLPQATRRLIVDKAEGNPFYVEEVIRSLVDVGALELHDGRYRSTAKLHNVAIPGSVQEVIMARVDRLAEPTRRLLQIGSVIGRTFYRSVLSEIFRRQGYGEQTLEHDLDLLRERQLLTERSAGWAVTIAGRTVIDEMEYLFTHALAQQTIYESLLQKTRREFHGLVADTIETVFAERVSDFYGLLAYHYSRAEIADKAEEYLFKAGEAAARSAASREALNLFQEASRLYLRNHPDGGDPAKRIQLEKAIAVALWNIGDLTESIEHFDVTLQQLGVYVPRTPLAANVKLVGDFLAVLYRLYAGTANRPADRNREVIQVMYMKGRAETTHDPRRVFMDSVAGIRRLNRTDPRQIDQACGMYATMAAFMAYSGVSFAISRRFLQQAKRVRRDGNPVDRFTYESMRFVTNYLAGDWQEATTVPDDAVDAALRNGQLWDVQTYFTLECDMRARQGRFDEARRRIAQLAEMSALYGYEFAQSAHDGQTALLLIEERRLPEALEAVEHYYSTRSEDSLRILALGARAKIETLQGQLEAASLSLEKAAEMIQRSQVVPAWHLSAYAVGRLLHDVAALEAALSGGATPDLLARQARKSRRYAVSVGNKVRIQRTEIFQLAGRLAWLVGRHREAVKWWGAAIDEGRRLGAHPELARAYAEIGSRLASRQHAVNTGGLDPAQCFTEARRVFETTGLSGDLSRLPPVAADREVIAS